jgi:hypothetical protein
MDGINLNAAYFGAPDPFDDPHPKTSDDNSFLDNFDGVAWDEQVAKERAPIDGEEALRHANNNLWSLLGSPRRRQKTQLLCTQAFAEEVPYARVLLPIDRSDMAPMHRHIAISNDS